MPTVTTVTNSDDEVEDLFPSPAIVDKTAQAQDIPTTQSPFKGTLSQFDTSLESPEHQKDDSVRRVTFNLEPQVDDNGFGANVSPALPDHVREESFSDLLENVMKQQQMFEDGSSAIEDNMLELKSLLCLEHGNMLAFEIASLGQLEDMDMLVDQVSEEFIAFQSI